MTGYVRQDTSNNISNGSVIDADDLDLEFNAVETAFNSSAGHTHDGTSGSGGPIAYSNLTGKPTLGTAAATAATDYATAAQGALANSALQAASIGVSVQAYDAGLTSIAGLTTAADRMIYTTASDTYAVATLTSAGRALLDDASASAQLVTLGLTATATQLNYVAGVTSAIQTQLNTKAPSSSPTLTSTTLNSGYTEQVFAVTGTTPALSPTNGSIQTWTLSGNSTPTAGTWATGQSLTLLVDDGSAYSITWSSLSVVWKTDKGTAPELNTSGNTVIGLWKVGTTIYGARVGDA